MSVFKDEKTNKWYAMVRFTDWQGQRKQKCNQYKEEMNGR